MKSTNIVMISNFIYANKIKIANIITAHPKSVTFGIGLVTILSIETTIGMTNLYKVFVIDGYVGK
jgi:hypothetical protein